MSHPSSPSSGGPELLLFYDGLCPLCSREVAFLRRRDRQARLGFIDIAGPDFDPTPWGLDLPTLMRAMHAVDADGRVLVGLSVFRRAYRLVGLGWLIGWTGWPVLRPFADLGYRAFARIRPRLSSLRCTDRCAVDA